MKKLFKRDTILAFIIPFVFIWTSQPLGVAKEMVNMKIKEIKVRTIEDYNSNKNFDLI